jgi:squalene-associated FAD-dependent desaturase
VAAKLNVGIIGAGYAGMAAAATLAARGVPVTVFESAKQLGGRARGVCCHGVELDNGQHILLGCYRATLQIIAQVGGNIEQDFLRLPLQLVLHKRFELRVPALPAPLHLLAGLLGAQGLSWAQKLRAIRFMSAMRGINFTLPRDIGALELLKAHAQDETVNHLLWGSICIAALNTPVEKASAQVLLNVLRDSLLRTRADSDMLLPRINLSALFPERAAEYVRQRGGMVHTSHGITSTIPRGSEVELAGNGWQQNFSHAICAASPACAARLFRAHPTLAPVAAQIEKLSFQPIYSVYLQYPAVVRLPHAMSGFAGGLAQWLFDRGRIAGQHGLIVAVISAEGMHQGMAHEQLAQKVVQELRERLGVMALPLWHQVIAEKRATFSCEPNLSRPARRAPQHNIWLAGDYTDGAYPSTLEGAVMSGIQCANEILAINDK